MKNYKEFLKESSVAVLAGAMMIMPLTGCAGNNTGAATGSSVNTENTTVASEETTSDTVADTSVTSETSSQDEKLTEDQAKKAFEYYMIKNLSEFEARVARFWYFDKTEGDKSTFWFTVNNVQYPVRIDIDLATGEAKASAYERKGGDLNPIEDPGVSEYDFNAWDYIKNPPKTADNNAKDIKSYLGTNIDDAVKEYSDLKYQPEKSKNGWLNSSILFDTYKKDSKTIEYIKVFGGSDYSIYGVICGMNMKDAIGCIVMNGATSLIPGNNASASDASKQFYFEMRDGNTVELVLDMSNNVIYVGVLSEKIKTEVVPSV